MAIDKSMLDFITGIAIILVILFLLIALLPGNSVGEMFNSGKVMFSFITAYLYSQLSAIFL